jgi:uncharacterized membrane protein
MPSAQAWEKGLGSAMGMAIVMVTLVPMSWLHRLFVVLMMRLVERPAAQLRINHCKMEAAITAAALMRERLWRGIALVGLVPWRFP